MTEYVIPLALVLLFSTLDKCENLVWASKIIEEELDTQVPVIVQFLLMKVTFEDM